MTLWCRWIGRRRRFRGLLAPPPPPLTRSPQYYLPANAPPPPPFDPPRPLCRVEQWSTPWSRWKKRSRFLFGEGAGPKASPTKYCTLLSVVFTLFSVVFTVFSVVFTMFSSVYGRTQTLKTLYSVLSSLVFAQTTKLSRQEGSPRSSLTIWSDILTHKTKV